MQQLHAFRGEGLMNMRWKFVLNRQGVPHGGMMRRAFIWMTMGSLNSEAIIYSKTLMRSCTSWQKSDTGTDELLDGHQTPFGVMGIFKTVDGTLSHLSWKKSNGPGTEGSDEVLRRLPIGPFQCSDETLTELILHLDQQLLSRCIRLLWQEYHLARGLFGARNP